MLVILETQKLPFSKVSEFSNFILNGGNIFLFSTQCMYRRPRIIELSKYREFSESKQTIHSVEIEEFFLSPHFRKKSVKPTDLVQQHTV